jgi:hypothetical protein
MLSHFRSCGYNCDEQTNPGDFVLDLITIDLRHRAREAESSGRVKKLLNAWSAKANETTKTPDTHISEQKDFGVFTKSTAPFTTAFPILFHRSSLSLWRERNAMIARIMNVVPYGALIALFFVPFHTDYQAILTRLGLIQLLCFLYFMGTIINTSHYPLERRTMDQEIQERGYTVLPFFLSFSLLELPFTIVAALLTTIVAVFPLVIRDAETFFAICFDIFALLPCGESLSMALNSILADSGLSLSVASMLVCIAQTMAGVLSINMPGFLRGINHTSLISYTASNLAPYFFRGVVFDCSPE